MSDENLRICIEVITQPNDGGYELVFSPEWETRIYFTGLRDFDICAIYPSSKCRLFSSAARKRLPFGRKQPMAKMQTLERSTHLLLLERPKEVFDIIQSFLKTLESNALPSKNVGSKLPDFKEMRSSYA